MDRGRSKSTTRKNRSGYGPVLHAILRLILVVALLFLLAVSVLVLLHRQLLNSYAPQILEQVAWEFEYFYDLNLEWEDQEITGVADYSISEVTIIDIEKAQVLLTCDFIRIKSNLLASYLPGGYDPLESVTAIELTHPVLTLGREKGKWNTGRLLEPTEGEAFDFPGSLGIKLVDSEIHWLGGEFTDGVPFPSLSLSDLNGSFRMETDDSMSTDLTGTLESTGFEPSNMEITGIFDPAVYMFEINVNGENVDLGILGQWMATLDISYIAGRGDTELSMLIGPDAGEDGFSLLGYASVRDGSIGSEVAGINAVDIHGDLNYTHESIFTPLLKGRIHGSDVTVRGRIGNFADPVYDVVCDVKALDIAAALGDSPIELPFPLRGVVNGRFELSGPQDKLEFFVSANSDRLVVNRIPVRVKKIIAWFAEDTLVVDYCNLGIWDGSAFLSGAVDTGNDSPEWKFDISARDIPSDRLAMLEPSLTGNSYFPVGTVSGDLTVRGKGLDDYRASGLVVTDNLNIPVYPSLGPVRAGFPVRTDATGIKLAGGYLKGKGFTVISDGNFDPETGFSGKVLLSTDDKGIIGNLTGVQAEGNIAVGGEFNFSFGEGPGFDGEVYLSDGNISGLTLPSVSGRLAFRENELVLSNISGIVNSGVLEGDIRIPLSTETALDGKIGSFNMDGIDVSGLIPEKYTPVTSSRLSIDGDLNYASHSGNLVVNMSVSETGAEFGPNVIRTGDTGVRLRLLWPLTNEGESELTVDGKLSMINPGRISEVYPHQTGFGEKVAVEITDLLKGKPEDKRGEELPRLARILGEVEIDAELRDIGPKTRGRMKVYGSDLYVQGIDISTAEFDLVSETGDNWIVDLGVVIEPVEVEEPDLPFPGEYGIGVFPEEVEKVPGVIHITGEVNVSTSLSESSLNLSAGISDIDIVQLMVLTGYQQKETMKGTISGNGTIIGTLQKPRVNAFEVYLSESMIYGVSLSRGKVVLNYEPPVLTLDDFNVEGSGPLRAMGAGSLDLSSKSLTDSSIVFRLDELRFNAKENIPEINLPVSGFVSGTAQITQDGIGSKFIYNAKVHDTGIMVAGNEMTIGTVNCEAVYRPGSDRIEITNLELIRSGELITVTGFVPVSLTDWLNKDLLDLTIKSDTGYTPDIPRGLLAAEIEWQGGLGPIDLHLHGKLPEPLLTGYLKLDIRDVKFANIVVMNRLDGTLHIEDSLLRVSPDDFVITGDGWELGLEGQADLLDYYPARLRNRGYPPPSVSTIQKTEGPVRFAGPGVSLGILPGKKENAPALEIRDGKPAITGAIDVTGGEVDMGKLGSTTPTGSGVNVFELDFDVNLTGTVKVANGKQSELRFTRGNLHISGPATQPRLSGKLYADRGWIGYELSSIRFNLTDQLEVTFSELHGFDPLISGEAQTTLRNVRQENSDSDEIVITARFNSRLSSLMDEMELSSDPPMSREQIIEAIAYQEGFFRTFAGTIFGDDYGAPGFEDVKFGDVVLPYISSYVSSYIRSEVGLMDFEVSFDEEERLRLYIENEVFDNVVMFYRQTFGAELGDDYIWGARYRWRPRSWIGFEVDNDEEVTTSMQYIVPLN